MQWSLPQPWSIPSTNHLIYPSTTPCLRYTMSVIFSRLEVVESRIASYSCPTGTTGRVHSLRLRRCFHNNNPRPQSITLSSYQPLVNIREPTTGIYMQIGNTSEQPHALGDQAHETSQATSLISALPGRHHQRRIDTWYQKYDKNGDIAKRHKLRRLEGLGDVMSLSFPDLPTGTGTGLLYSALRLENPHLVLKALGNLIKYDGEAYTSKLLETIPPSTFSEILRFLDPAHFVDRLVSLQQEVGPATAQRLKLPQNENGYVGFCKIFLKQVNTILEVRAQQHPLSTSDLRYLLKCARRVGSDESAHAIWRSMTSISRKDPDKRIIPDAECYNHYMASKCWADTFNADRRYTLRVIPSHLKLRTWAVPPHVFQGHRVGPEGGIKAQVSEIFRQMVESGIQGNEETFCLMMVALGREGDVSGISNILQRVWGIDADTVLMKHDSEVPSPKSFSPQSPFYPSEQLLFTLAHVYGINNAIPSALRLVDYVSRQYNVSIPLKVWNELLQWTYVTSVKRTGQNPETNSEDLKTGQLAPEAVSSLWDTMTLEPYNVEPTMEMYNRLITNLLRRGRYGEAKIRIEEGYRANRKHVYQLSHDTRDFRASHPHNPTHSEHARDVYIARLRVRRNRLYIRRWVKQWIQSGSLRMRFNETFSSQDLPNFMKQWERFLPVRVRYAVANGEVVFTTGVREANFRMQQSFADGAKGPNLLSKRLILPSSLRRARGMLGRSIFRRRKLLEEGFE